MRKMRMKNFSFSSIKKFLSFERVVKLREFGMSEDNLSINLSPNACVHTRIRGRSLSILLAMKEHGALMFWEIQEGFKVNNDLTWTYLRNLRRYGLIYKTEQGWSLTEKGEQFLSQYEKRIKKVNNITDNFTGNTTGNTTGKLTGNLPVYLPANLPAYNNNNNITDNNNINNMPNSFIFSGKMAGFENKISPSFVFASSSLQKEAHTYEPVSYSRSATELQQVQIALLEKFGAGSTIGKKLVYQMISTTLPYVDRRSIKSRLDKLVSIGFLNEVGNGLYKIAGGGNNGTV
jgi:predicted transcriptional regulator